MDILLPMGVNCVKGHNFVIYHDHPRNIMGIPECPHCMSIKLSELIEVNNSSDIKPDKTKTLPPLITY